MFVPLLGRALASLFGQTPQLTAYSARGSSTQEADQVDESRAANCGLILPHHIPESRICHARALEYRAVAARFCIDFARKQLLKGFSADLG
jgi:hypothetical protein